MLSLNFAQTQGSNCVPDAANKCINTNNNITNEVLYSAFPNMFKAFYITYHIQIENRKQKEKLCKRRKMQLTADTRKT